MHQYFHFLITFVVKYQELKTTERGTWSYPIQVQIRLVSGNKSYD